MTQNSTPMPVKLAHHKMGPGVAAMNSPGFQEMDEYAPYRIAFLFLFVVSSVALWVSYKCFCKRSKTDEEAVAYRPLATASGGADAAAWMDAEWADADSSCSSEDSAFLTTKKGTTNPT